MKGTVDGILSQSNDLGYSRPMVLKLDHVLESLGNSEQSHCVGGPWDLVSQNLSENKAQVSDIFEILQAMLRVSGICKMALLLMGVFTHMGHATGALFYFLLVSQQRLS